MACVRHFPERRGIQQGWLVSFERERCLWGTVVRNIALVAERLTYAMAHISISTNESYKQIAMARGRKSPDQVIVVRNGPQISRISVPKPDLTLRKGRRFLVGYLGIMGP